MFEILHIKLFHMVPLVYFFKVLVIFAVLSMTLGTCLFDNSLDVVDII